ncbi:MAG: SRPBCC family protein [Chloroflexota bacterium]|nr:SRPBCC family protein [Chloroflexota bacterium]
MANTLDQSVDIGAPADRLWDLISTSEGLSGWFVDATVVPGLQGSVTLRFALGAEATMPILVWDPPHRITFGIPDERIHEITISASAGGSRVQLHDEGVHDAEARATATGWAGFLGKLRVLAETGR